MKAKLTPELHSFFHLPLSVEVFAQLGQLQSIMQEIHLTDLSNIWTYSWGSATFSLRKAYRQLSGHCNIHSALKWLWKSSYQNKHRVFIWLLMKDRLSTRGLLKRRNMEMEDYKCVLCNGQKRQWNTSLLIVPLHRTVGG